MQAWGGEKKGVGVPGSLTIRPLTWEGGDPHPVRSLAVAQDSGVETAHPNFLLSQLVDHRADAVIAFLLHGEFGRPQHEWDTLREHP